ncbi:PIR protein [Plasmodium vivax]|nr:PIR protein [Plasmodium vivax]
MEYPDLEYYENNDGQKEEVRKLLKNLTLYNFYEKIDIEFKNHIESEKCNTCNEKLSNLANADNELLKLCKAVCNFILNNDNFQKFCEGKSCESSCTDVKFRLYDHVIKINEFSPDIKNFYDALNSISKNAKFEMTKCLITNFDQKKDEFRHFKYLYEFLSNFLNIRYKISEKYNYNDKLYCRYIKEFFKFYNSIRKNCTRGSTYKYCGIFEQIKTKLITNEQLIFIYGKCKYEKTSCTPDSIIYDDIPCLKDKEDIFNIPEANSDLKNGLNILFNAAIPVVSISTIFYIFYKFTPLGFWLRSKVRRKKNIPSPINEEKYHPSYDTNFKITDPDRRIYNIQYK